MVVPHGFDMRIHPTTRDRLSSAGATLRKGFALPDRVSDRQFQSLIHRLARAPSSGGEPT
jgi:hypothetical protein